MGMIVCVSMVTKSNHFMKYSIGKFLMQTFKDGYQNGSLKCIKNHSVIYVVAPFLIGVFAINRFLAFSGSDQAGALCDQWRRVQCDWTILISSLHSSVQWQRCIGSSEVSKHLFTLPPRNSSTARTMLPWCGIMMKNVVLHLQTCLRQCWMAGISEQLLSTRALAGATVHRYSPSLVKYRYNGSCSSRKAESIV